jgi:hypothetical protein
MRITQQRRKREIIPSVFSLSLGKYLGSMLPLINLFFASVKFKPCVELAVGASMEHEWFVGNH